ncbi:hypothetical protein [Streptomyces sp. NPDC058766]|uniref:hypothetical protein n=1 Tax=Streptomyces sp. NPDC058766 TaxID=3346630 RepID=UPI0036CAF2A3
MTAHDNGTPSPDDERTEALTPASGQERTEVFTSASGQERTEALTPAHGQERTEVFTSASGQERTEVLAPASGQERTEALTPAHGQERTEVFTPASGQERIEVLTAPGEHTRVLVPSGEGVAPALPLTPDGRPGPAEDPEYSATVLASHWIERPEQDDTRLERPAGRQPQTAPDRTDGSVLRFGPGVTAAVAHRTHRTLPTAPAPAAPPRRRWRGHVLPALVVLCVLAFLAWQRLGPPLAVTSAEVTARPEALGCGGTARITGVVTTNGRPGTLTYRWVRSDGTSSGVLEETTARGQSQARLQLRWTFEGAGHHTARAELRLLSPSPRTVSTRFSYDCP